MCMYYILFSFCEQLLHQPVVLAQVSTILFLHFWTVFSHPAPQPIDWVIVEQFVKTTEAKFTVYLL